MIKKILIFGKNGQLATDLAELINDDENYSFDVCDSKDVDLSKIEDLKKFIAGLPAYDIVVNATAYNFVDKAEKEKDLAMKINDAAATIMADFCKKNDSLFIHYSTNYVFDGNNSRPNLENDFDFIKPLGAYGNSKLKGEASVVNSGCRYLIFRLATVFRENKTNFLAKMLELFAKNEELKIVDDQVTNPSYSFDVAEATIKIIKKVENNFKSDPRLNKIYHLCNSGKASYFEFCVNIYEKVRKDNRFSVITKKITPIASSEFVTPAQRPLNAVMNAEKIKKDFDISLPSWQDAVSRAISKTHI